MQAHRLAIQPPLRATVCNSLGTFAALLFLDGSCNLQCLTLKDRASVSISAALDAAFLYTISAETEGKSQALSQREAREQEDEGDVVSETLNKTSLFAIVAIPYEQGRGIQLQAWQCLALEETDSNSPFTSTLIQLRGKGTADDFVSLSASTMPGAIEGAGAKVFLDLAPEPFIMLKASINFLAIYSPVIAQIWLLSARTMDGMLSLSLCSVIDCSELLSNLYLAPQYLLQGAAGGVRIWRLRHLVKSRSSKKSMAPKEGALSCQSTSHGKIPLKDADESDTRSPVAGIENSVGNADVLRLAEEDILEKGLCFEEQKIPRKEIVNGFIGWHPPITEGEATPLNMEIKLQTESNMENSFSSKRSESVFIAIPHAGKEHSRHPTKSSDPELQAATFKGQSRVGQPSVASFEKERTVTSIEALGGNYYLLQDSEGSLHVLCRVASSASSQQRPATENATGGSRKLAKHWTLQSLPMDMSVNSFTAFPLQPALTAFGGAFEVVRIWLSDGGLSIHIGCLHLQAAEAEDEQLGLEAISSGVRFEVERVVMADAPVKLLAAISPSAALAGSADHSVLYVMERG